MKTMIHIIHIPRLFPVLLSVACALAWPQGARADSVKASEKDVVIPTYLVGEPDANPMFYLGKDSQGAQGRVYPYPLYDTLTSIKSNKVYRMVYLENEYVRIGVLPEEGGRLFEGVDKSNGYNFVYRQHVIKPALIGLIGAWISGGIEWNVPHHHRATTALPVQYRLEANADGSKTVWVGELEVRHRMRWAVGYTLYPGKSYVECSVRIVNRTPFANSMLCFANVAVHVNENYQVIYPNTQVVTFHGKREFATWPVATNRFAAADFSRGVDVSWFTNHFEANSMFAWNYEDDFFAGYDHGKQAGIMSYADHHVVPGKKFWTWGNGPRGRMWDKILTDDDGPYIELMVGAYSDNQPDYSWLQPYETKAFEMYWYPFRDIGGVKHATLEGAVNLEVAPGGAARLGFCTTAPYRNATVLLKAGDRVLLEQNVAITPAKPFVKLLTLPAGVSEGQLRASLSADGRELLAYAPPRLAPVKIPAPVKDPGPPKDVATVEELYLAGQRIEQFHAPGLEPEPYWEEALRRDPGDARVNTAWAIRLLKQGRFTEAERHLRRAIERLTTNYTAPKEGEPFYYLGLALQCQAAVATGQGGPPAELPRVSALSFSAAQGTGSAADKLAEANAAYSKATWSQAWRGPAWFGLAEIASCRGQYAEALRCVDRSLEANALSLRALTLKAALLRHTGRAREALAIVASAQQRIDPLDVRLMAEGWLAGEKKSLERLDAALREHPATGLETAAEYSGAGLWQDGALVLERMTASRTQGPSPGLAPLVNYYLADFAERLGADSRAATLRRQAAELPPDRVFPFQWEMMGVLQRAMASEPSDARAPFYLGELVFEGQPELAASLWRQAAALDPASPMTRRNLAVAYSRPHAGRDVARAIAELEQAVAAPAKYAIHFTELDELYAEAGAPPEKRLALLEQNHAVVLQRDDALSREIGLKVFAGKYDQAIGLMTGRKFSVWEGGKLDVADHWVDAHLLRGRQRLRARQFDAARADFHAARAIPDNLPTEQELGRDAEISWWLGAGCAAAGDPEEARRWWKEAAESGVGSRRRNRDRLSKWSPQAYYRALADQQLGNTAQAQETLRELIDIARKELNREPGSEDPRGAKAGLAHYVAGLGYLGLGDRAKANAEFELSLKETPDLLGARAELVNSP